MFQATSVLAMKAGAPSAENTAPMNVEATSRIITMLDVCAVRNTASLSTVQLSLPWAAVTISGRRNPVRRLPSASPSPRRSNRAWRGSAPQAESGQGRTRGRARSLERRALRRTAADQLRVQPHPHHRVDEVEPGKQQAGQQRAGIESRDGDLKHRPHDDEHDARWNEIPSVPPAQIVPAESLTS